MSETTTQSPVEPTRENDSPDSWFRRVTARVVKWVSVEWNDFWYAVFEAWWRVSLGVIVGVALLLISFPLEHTNKNAARFLEHIGMAFLVAAVAIFGYEWKSHRKTFVEVTKSMAEVLHAQRLAGAVRCVEETFPGDDALRKALRTSIADLLRETDHLIGSNLWHRKIALGLVVALVESATENARKFPEGAESGFQIELPRPAKLTGAMLQTQIASLHHGAVYQVISDYTSFQKNQLKEFVETTNEQIKHGIVEVRRIFFCFEHDFELPLDEVDRIIDDHWKYACESKGGYRVGFITPKRGAIEPLHEGVFIQGNVGIRFRPARDLSKMGFFPDRVEDETEDVYHKLEQFALFAAPEADIAREDLKKKFRSAWSQNKKKKKGGRRPERE